ncbi:MAG: helix-turn-helix transcriptional regulator [Bacteroidales bacterium]|nr:helix-turn-helix transcriptional regulator [Bacteroidales bacterium]
MNPLNVYINIKSFRELRKITREDISAQLGMSVSGYGKIERGEVDISLSKLVAIADILQVELSILINFEISEAFQFILEHTSMIQSPEPREDTLNMYRSQLHEKYLLMLEKEIERLSKKLKEGQ